MIAMASNQPPVNVADPSKASAPSVRTLGLAPNVWVAILVVVALVLLVAIRKGFVGALGD